MTVVFVVCAAVGTTVLVLQFLLALIGLGGDAMGVDVPHDFGHDMGGGDHDFSPGETDHDLAPGQGHGELTRSGSAADQVPAPLEHSAGNAAHGSASLFRMLSLRTITAALAFFGLAGLAAKAADCTDLIALVIAAAAGTGAMYVVYSMLRGMRSLQAEGTVQIHQAVGELATVYLRIPAGTRAPERSRSTSRTEPWSTRPRPSVKQYPRGPRSSLSRSSARTPSRSRPSPAVINCFPHKPSIDQGADMFTASLTSFHGILASPLPICRSWRFSLGPSPCWRRSSPSRPSRCWPGATNVAPATACW